MKKKNLVIIGSRSFIGKNIVESYKNDFNLISISSKIINLEKRINAKKVQSIIPKNSTIIFLAFKTKHNNLSEKNLIENILIISNFISLIEILKPVKVIFFSSISVYGDNNNYKNLTEKSFVKPDNDYGKAKAVSEILLSEFSKKLKFKLLIIRIPRVYGRYDYANNYGPTKFLHDIANKKNILIWGDGKEKKHFLYIQDLLNNLKKLIKSNAFGTYNLCPTESYSFINLGKIILQSFNTNSIIKFRKRNGIKSNHIIDNKKLLKIKGIKFTNIRLALNEYFLILK